MIKTETIIGVADVERSSAWYRQLLGCKSNHGGDVFEILADENDTTILCLHAWHQHNHPTLTNPAVTPGNGLILYFRVDDVYAVWNNAKDLKAVIEVMPHINQNSGKEEFSLRDPDGYYITVSL